VSKLREQLRAIHERVVAGDPAAPSDLFITVQGPIVRVLYGRFRSAGLSWEAAGDLATDALLSYLSAPERFDQERASLFTYLVIIANGDALNRCRDRRKEQKKYAQLVELSAVEGNVEEDAQTQIESRIDAERLIRSRIDDIAETDMDRRVLELMLQGERETAAYAVVLGIDELPASAQRSAVKQYRDKIDKRLKRLGETLR
jgi:RNA polymerase sigma factor (sigma-70 family)